MTEALRPSFEKLAFLGEKAKNHKFFEKVNTTAEKLNQLLSPVAGDTPAERKRNEGLTTVVDGLAEGTEWKCDSVRRLVETASDTTRTANTDLAEKRLDVLASATYIAMKHGENVALQNALGTNDGAVIDAALPESLRGIGGRVAEIAIEQEITNPVLKEALKKLDRRADILRASGLVGEEKLKELIADKILELSELADNLDDKGYAELTRVSAFLGSEADRIGIRLSDVEDGRVTSGNRQGAREPRPRDWVPPPRDGEEDQHGQWGDRDSMDMQMWRYRELEASQEDPHIYPGRMPEWYNRLPKSEREVWDVRFKILEATATKKAIRNGAPMEKIRQAKPELKAKEVWLLMESMPGFRESLQILIQDLCMKEVDSDGRVFLRLKADKATGVIDSDVRTWCQNVESLQAHIAQRLAGVMGHDGITDLDRDAVNTMWNFMYLGDPLEAWDVGRQLKPSDSVSDKVRTAFRLRDKFLGKNGIYKVSGAPEWGEEEPFISHSMFQWVARNLDRDRKGFTQRILQGDLVDIFPDRMAVSMPEIWTVTIRPVGGRADGKDDYQTSMALAMLGEDQNGRPVTIDMIRRPDPSDPSAYSDINMLQTHKDMEEGADFLSQMFKGDIPLDMRKSLDQVAKSFVQAAGLTRQEPFVPVVGVTDGKKFAKLGFPDKPMFYWSILLNSVGFNWRDDMPLLDMSKLTYNGKPANGDNYPLAVAELVDILGVRSTVNQRDVLHLLGVRPEKKPVGGDNIFADIKEYLRVKIHNSKVSYSRQGAFSSKK